MSGFNKLSVEICRRIKPKKLGKLNKLLISRLRISKEKNKANCCSDG
jgi:hypothetical protein